MRHPNFALCVAALLVSLGCSRNFSPPSGPATLVVQVAPATVAPLGVAQLTAHGGTPPYTFGLVADHVGSGAAQLDPTSGVYQAGAGGNVSDQVQVTDASHATAQATVLITAPLSVAPNLIGLAPGQRWSFSIAGGRPPYRAEVDSPCGSSSIADGCLGPDAGCPALADGGIPSCVDTCGTYQAGEVCGATTELVVIHDQNDAGARAAVQLGALLDVAPTDGSITVLPGGQVSFAPTGGVPPYTFQFAPHGNVSGGGIDTAGHYTAGPGNDADDAIEIHDHAGSLRTRHVHVDQLGLDLPGPVSYELATADFNGDGLADLAALSLSPQLPQMFVMLGNGRGFGPPQVITMPAALANHLQGDFSGDGFNDLAAITHLVLPSGAVTVDIQFLEGQPDGHLAIGPRMTLDTSQISVIELPCAIDLRSIGGPVALVIPFSVNVGGTDELKLAFFAVDPAGGTFPSTYFGPQPLREIGIATLNEQGLDPAFFRMSDVRGTGTTLQALMVDGDQNNVRVRQLSFMVVDGGFGAVGEPLVDVPVDDGFTFSAGAVDFDGDGRGDLLVYESSDGEDDRVIVMLSRPDGGFAAPIEKTMPFAFGSFFSGRTLDGKREELDAVGPNGTTYRWMLDGGTFVDLPPAGVTGPQDVLAADLNGDGASDFTVLDNAGHARVLLGDFSGVVGQRHLAGLPFGVQGLVSADLDGDGKPDVLAFGAVPRVLEGVGGDQLATTGDLDVPLSGASAQGTHILALATLPDGGSAVANLSASATSPQAVLSPSPDGRPLIADAALGDGGVYLLTGSPQEGVTAYLASLQADGTVATVPGATPLANDNGTFVAPVDFLGYTGGLAMVVWDPNYPATDVLLIPPLLNGGWNANNEFDQGEPLGLDFDETAPDGVVAFATFSLRQGGPRNITGVLAIQDNGTNTCGDPTGLAITDVSTADPSVEPYQAFDLGLGCFPAVGVLVPVDLDGDGNTDLVVSNGTQTSVTLFYGNGQGNFSRTELPVGGPVTGVAVVDQDGDGQLDLLVSRSDSATLELHRGGVGRIFR